jgi:hypothetical protein
LLRSFLSLEEAGNPESAKDSVRYPQPALSVNFNKSATACPLVRSSLPTGAFRSRKIHAAELAVPETGVGGDLSACEVEADG